MTSATARIAGLFSALVLGGLVAASTATAASSWFISNSANGTGPTITIGFGELGDVFLAGDWNGDGTDTPGVFRARSGAAPVWLLSNNTTGAGPLISFAWGAPGDLPLVGDWNGDGADTVGIFRAAPASGQEFYLATSNVAGGGGVGAVTLGNPGDRPITGDWNGDGIDTIGIFRHNGAAPDWFEADSNATASGGTTVNFANPTDNVIFTGDWDGDRHDSPGVFRNEAGAGIWGLAGSNAPGGGTAVQFPFGNGDDQPVPGDWDANGTSTPATVRAALEFVPPPPAPVVPVPNGQNASRQAKLAIRFTSTRKTSRRIGFASRPAVAGKLVNEAGAPIGAASIAVLARRRQSRAATSQIDTVTTAADGGFSYRAPSGPSRTLTFAYTAFSGDPQPAQSKSLRTLVRASLTAAVTPRSPRTGRRLRVAGRLRYLPRSNVQITIQARDGKVWRAVGNVKTRARGRYSWPYRFKQSARGRRFAFRAHVDSPVYPFTPGNSKAVSVRVR